MPATNTGKLADPEWRRVRAKKANAAQRTPEYLTAKIRELVDQTRAEQGLPPRVTDALVLQKVADILRAPSGQGASDAA